jgi:hypothetical protein
MQVRHTSQGLCLSLLLLLHVVGDSLLHLAFITNKSETSACVLDFLSSCCLQVSEGSSMILMTAVGALVLSPCVLSHLAV